MNAASLRTLCLSLPGATETIQWGDNRVFKVGGKMFAISGYEADSLYSIKVADDRFLELSDLPGFKPAPYLARARWVQVDLVREGYEIIFAKLTKKLKREIRSAS